ncbi:MAG: mandelate racemase/muconate lactonizing enzyme family protein [Planctomycetaceae bacterium]|nr:mandelate racemase/muconate lactonizing enzyme family protein [Planctomycetaceae bacterium]
MKIHDLEFFLVGGGQSNSTSPERRLLVRVKGSPGFEGWGEAGLAWRPTELGERRESLLAVLAGRSIYDVEELHCLDALTPSPFRAAVEMAVWDLLGRTLRQPLCNLLGGYYRRRIPVSVRLPGSRPKQAAYISRELADQGFHTQTILTGGRPDEDVKTIAGIRELVGDRIELRLDAQGRFGFDDAMELCAGLEEQRMQFVIDPLVAGECHSMAALGRQTSAPLCLWRVIQTPADTLAAVRCNAAPFVVIDLEQVGGIVPARACAAVAAAAGVSPLLGGHPSLGIATAAMLHVAAATAAFSTANEMASQQSREVVLKRPFEVTDGMISVPEGHGLGIEIDRTILERLQPSA